MVFQKIVSSTQPLGVNKIKDIKVVFLHISVRKIFGTQGDISK